jgi:glycosyltransferase involved in cell wall biosynthesis
MRSQASGPPLVSIVTAVRNGAAYLPALIDSVRGQDYLQIEHVVIDDGSDDQGATVAVLEKYRHLRWWRRDNRGQYATQNEAIAASRGSIIGVIAADDVYLPGAVRAAVEFLEGHPECSMVYGRTLQMDEDGRRLPYQVEPGGDYPRWLLRYCLFVQHCSLFVRKGLFAGEGVWFDPSFRYAGDWDWILRLSAAGRMGYLPRALSMVRVHSFQTSRMGNPRSMLDEYRRVCRASGTSYLGFRAVRKVLQFRALVLMVWGIGRTRGLEGLWMAARRWCRSHWWRGHATAR